MDEPSGAARGKMGNLELSGRQPVWAWLASTLFSTEQDHTPKRYLCLRCWKLQVIPNHSNRLCRSTSMLPGLLSGW